MTLYEIDRQIQDVLLLLDPDPETGEIKHDINEVMMILDGLQGSREEKLDHIVKYILNLQSDADALKAEEQRLKESRQKKEKKIESLKNYLAFAIGYKDREIGLNKVAFSHRKVVSIVDEAKAIRCLREHGFNDCVKVKEEISKTEVKRLIDNGCDIDGIMLTESGKMSIK